MDKLNALAYTYHYRNIDSTECYARRALSLCRTSFFSSQRAEALNSLAFVEMVRMNYAKADSLLGEAIAVTDNQIELAVAEVQQMRLCQRRSRNREFHEHRERALSCLRRIDEERSMLTARQLYRLNYAESELAIVNSTYYYYVGLERQSIEALQQLNEDAVRHDTAQYLNYLYNIGAGGILTEGTAEQIFEAEIDFLNRCLTISHRYHYPYFEAQAKEALAEHTGNVALAEEALALFRSYGDVYQTAGAYRTLASCYHAMGDDEKALENLYLALSDSAINQAPDLVASIREQLSVACSALDDKPGSDYHRNIYIDLQEQTRQDRELEARAGLYDQAVSQLNWMIWAVVAAILLLLFMLWLFNNLHHKRREDLSIDELLTPLREWQEGNRRQTADLQEHYEEIAETLALHQLHIRNNERRNLEQRAKLSLVNSITPFIDRILHEAKGLEQHRGRNEERQQYIRELAEQINVYNDVLTHWIQLQQGVLSLHIETFPIQALFDVVAKGRMSFGLKGVDLSVEPSDAVVKADRVLTLFMLNTLADNARKFTPSGGRVTVSAQESSDYVEVAVEDTGSGIPSEQLDHLFDRQGTIRDSLTATASGTSHGFGLLNCKGIIEKYRKTSKIFSVCQLTAESRVGQGSRFAFRLPKGIVRAWAVLAVLSVSLSLSAISQQPLAQANIYADSAYFSNVNGTYGRTLQFADSCRKYLNEHYLQQHPMGRRLMLREGSSPLGAAEIAWFHDSLPTNYQIILDIRNESAVAALALHRWSLYYYNNKVYTQLFKEISADNTLADYCRVMQQSQTNKTIAVILLVLVLVMIPPAYYLLYYRHLLYYRFCVERIRQINELLLSDSTPEEKLARIRPLTVEQYPAELQDVVTQIQDSLHEAIALRQEQAAHIELAEDECRRAEYEDNNLYVSNAVLDNCLSALKHETMYYPSRIRQLVDAQETPAGTLREVVEYYRDLYSMLSLQAMRQVEHTKVHLQPLDHEIMGDANLIDYLFDLLRQQASGQALSVDYTVYDTHYVCVTVAMPALSLADEQAGQLFTPAAGHIPYLLCRQIVRDHGEATNRRGCGISVERDEKSGNTYIKIILPRYGKV